MKKVALNKVAKIDRTVATDDECLTLPYVGLEHMEKESGKFAEGFAPTPLNMLATNFRFTPKHVLYGKLRPYLNKVVLPNFDGVCTTEILPILPNEERLDRTFLWAILLSPAFVNWATSQISGANLPRLDPKLLAEYEIPLPPLAEQKRIAALLARADRLRQLRRAARALADSLLQSVFLEMFGEPETNPNGWNKDEFEKAIVSTQNGFGQREDYSPKGIIVLRIRDISSGRIDYSDPRRMIISENELAKYSLDHEDLILVRVNGNPNYVGIASEFTAQNEPIVFSDHIIRVKMDRKLLNTTFVVHLLNSPYGRKQTLGNISTTAGQFTINSSGLSRIKMIFPPLPLQEEFARVAARVEGLRARQAEAERQAEELFQSLLAESFG